MKTFKINYRDVSANVVATHQLLAFDRTDAESKLPVLLEACRFEDVVSLDIEK